MKRFLLKVLVTTGGVAAGEYIHGKTISSLPPTWSWQVAWARRGTIAASVVIVQKVANKVIK